MPEKSIIVNIALKLIQTNRGSYSSVCVKIALTFTIYCAIFKPMDTSILRKAGLTDSQAKGYLALIEHGNLSAADLAAKIGESRTNGYAIADRLVELGLATKDAEKKLSFSATHPSALELLAEKRRKLITRDERLLKQNMPDILSFYYAHSEQPGVRFFQGKDGIRAIHADIIATKQPLYLLRSIHDKDFLGSDVMENFIQRRVQAGIEVHALTPEHPDANRNPAQDSAWLFLRTWLPEGSYEEPVEINIYGNKVALLSFGEEATGTLIYSPQIASAMRQLFKLISSQLQTPRPTDARTQTGSVAPPATDS